MWHSDHPLKCSLQAFARSSYPSPYLDTMSTLNLPQPVHNYAGQDELRSQPNGTHVNGNGTNGDVDDADMGEYVPPKASDKLKLGMIYPPREIRGELPPSSTLWELTVRRYHRQDRQPYLQITHSAASRGKDQGVSKDRSKVLFSHQRGPVSSVLPVHDRGGSRRIRYTSSSSSDSCTRGRDEGRHQYIRAKAGRVQGGSAWSHGNGSVSYSTLPGEAQLTHTGTFSASLPSFTPAVAVPSSPPSPSEKDETINSTFCARPTRYMDTTTAWSNPTSKS